MQRTVSMPSFTIHSLSADSAEAWSFMKNLQRCKAEMFCAFCFLPGELIANRAVSLYTAIKAKQIFCRKINLPALLFPTLTMNLKGNILISTTDFGGVYLLQDVVSVSLPVNERMMIKKNHFEPYNLTGSEKRICIVTGIHGDELEGQYVCYELIRKLSENRHLLSGIVDIYPSMNPLIHRE